MPPACRGGGSPWEVTSGQGGQGKEAGRKFQACFQGELSYRGKTELCLAAASPGLGLPLQALSQEGTAALPLWVSHESLRPREKLPDLAGDAAELLGRRATPQSRG